MNALAQKFKSDYKDVETVVNIGECQYEAMICFNYYPGRPAKLYALPEDCYPQEDAEFELLNVKIDIAEGVWIDLPEDRYTLIQDELEEFANVWINDVDKF